MFFCIHLPDFMNDGGTRPVDGGAASRRSGVQVVSSEPAFEGTHRRNDLSGHSLKQVHPDQASTPGGVFTTQSESHLDGLGRGDQSGLGTMIIGHDPFDSVLAESREETTDGGTRALESRRDLVGLLSLLPESEDRLSDRNGKRAWHGRTSQRHYHEKDYPPVYRC